MEDQERHDAPPSDMEETSGDAPQESDNAPSDDENLDLEHLSRWEQVGKPTAANPLLKLGNTDSSDHLESESSARSASDSRIVVGQDSASQAASPGENPAMTSGIYFARIEEETNWNLSFIFLIWGFLIITMLT
ncbi:MAG: hypothetical protein HQM09_06270 [Candidatus Riflebacteria bacterium]|nr:hypothetical protein [Candidatus Riflebacteria bacterium]